MLALEEKIEVRKDQLDLLNKSIFKIIILKKRKPVQIEVWLLKNMEDKSYSMLVDSL